MVVYLVFKKFSNLVIILAFKVINNDKLGGTNVCKIVYTVLNNECQKLS